jgi:hypothetical protein
VSQVVGRCAGYTPLIKHVHRNPLVVRPLEWTFGGSKDERKQNPNKEKQSWQQ